MTLKIDKLTKTYNGREGKVAALADVSLTAEAGEFLAVMGPSGCGKSTLLLTAGGLQSPTEGTVEVAGKNLVDMTAEQRARHRAAHIGFVFQQFHLVPYLNVLDNVLAPSLALDIPDGRARARELVARFGLENRAGHVPAKLSTGERQRTALARALFPGPKLILADEPTGNLDRENAEIVLRHLEEFAAAGGTILLVTHDATMADRADRTLHLQEGRLCVLSDNGK